jgi:chromosome segregation ATPase
MDLDKFLNDLGLSSEERAKVNDAFSIEKLRKGVESAGMRQSTYARKEQELEAQRRTLQENWDKANAEYLAALADRDSTAAEKAELAQKLKDAEDKINKAPQMDPTKFVSREDHDRALREFAAGQTAYFGDTLEAVEQIRDLAGSKVSHKQLLQEALAAKKTPLEYAEEKYQLQAKRDERAKKADEERLEQVRKEEREKVISEMANPATRPLKPSQEPFYRPQEENKNPWDEESTPKHEADLLNELQTARG